MDEKGRPKKPGRTALTALVACCIFIFVVSDLCCVKNNWNLIMKVYEIFDSDSGGVRGRYRE